MPAPWSPSLLTEFRKKYKFSKSEMVRQLAAHGITTASWPTLHRWETGEMTPRPVYQDAIRRALEAIEAELGGRPARTRRKAASRRG